jgi:hypothetical protein
MAAIDFGDRLEVLGVAVGVLLILGSLGTLAGMPWTTNPNTPAVVAQLLGIVVTIGVGAALVWIVRRE